MISIVAGKFALFPSRSTRYGGLTSPVQAKSEAPGSLNRAILCYFIGCLFAAFSLASVNQAHASMAVSKAIVHFEPGKSTREDVMISNKDSEPLYVKVEIIEIKNPGMDNEVRAVVKNPKQSRFLVTPNKLVVPPGGRKAVRLVNLAPNLDKERVFRVNLTPVAVDEEAEQSTVKVLVAYQLLVLMQPQSPKADLVSKREGNKLILENKGNSNALLRSGLLCAKPDDQSSCTELPTKRLYAGNKWELDLEKSGSVSYIKATGLQNERVSF